MRFKLNINDNLRCFDCDPADVIRQACEVKNKACDLSDCLIDFPESKLVSALSDILQFLADVSIYFADVVSDRCRFDPNRFYCCRVRFADWYAKLDDLTRYHNICNVLRQLGFYFRSLYFSCRALNELLSRYFDSWLSLNPDFEIHSLSGFSRSVFDPVPPDIDLHYPAQRFII